MEKKKLFIIPNQHMDLVWRRCFERDFQFGGQNFVPYADLEELYINGSIALCDKYPFYHFSVECVAVLDKFLQRNPHMEEKIRQLIRDKRMYVPFTGNNIVDSNLVSGESIVRNYSQGYHYLKDKFDHIPDGADRNDAFGNCAQMPQIFRKFGVDWAYHVTYTPCEKPYWRGLDGSTVYDVEPTSVGVMGGYPKYRPCPACNGFRDTHCPVCGDTRIDQAHMDRRKFSLMLQEDVILGTDEPCYVLVGGEEVAPMEEIALWALENSEKYDITFTNFESYKQYYARQIQGVDTPPKDEIMESPECNCNNTGVYVSRIKVKQNFRRLENSIFAAEAIASSDYLKGKPYPKENLEDIWKKTLFVMFHDAITSTHVDAGYEEVMDTMAAAQNSVDAILCEVERPLGDTFCVTNPYGIALNGICCVTLNKGYSVADVPIVAAEETENGCKIQFAVCDIAPFATKTYHIIPQIQEQPQVLFSVRSGIMTGDAILTNTSRQEAVGGSISDEVVLENEFYRITAYEQGIREIFDKTTQRIVAKESQYLVGEWILETDIGSPWATLSTDMRRQRLSRYTKLIRHERTADRQTLTFQITPDVRAGFAETCFSICYTVSLVRGVDWVLLHGDVNWDAYDHRLRIAFPTTCQDEHMYDVPYGMMARKPYENDIVLPEGDSNWASAAGDYPALHWAGVDGEESVALFNRGTPSYQICQDDRGAETIYLSVLRSPTMPTCLHAAADYTMTAYDGMRDAGKHSFDYALKSYDGCLAESTVHADGIGFNARLPVTAPQDVLELPQLKSDNAWISAVCLAHNSKDLMVRVAEFRGKGGEFTLSLPAKVKRAHETDLKEDVIETFDQREVTGTINPFEIKTFILEV